MSRVLLRSEAVAKSNHGRGRNITSKSEFVGQIAFDASTDKHNPATALRTSKGIGFGSTVKQFRRAYPHAAGSGQYYRIGGKGDLATDFLFGKGRLEAITMSNIRVG